MKKFAEYILGLLIGIVAILFILDWSYTYITATCTARNKISYILSLENKSIDYIFIGSSRVDNNVDPDVIEKITGKTALNLGVQAAKPSDYLLMLQLLQNQNISSKIVFIQIDYAFNMEGSSNILRSSLMPYIDNKIIDQYLNAVDHDYNKLKHWPFYRYLKYDYVIGFRQVFNSFINNKPSIDLSSGYFPKFGQSPINKSVSLPDNIIEENQDIRNINEFAEANNIKIVYFIAPFCAQISNLDFTEKLQKKLPVFLNFTSIFSENQNYFFDCSHLNDAGAKEFSRILGKYINSSTFQFD